LLLDVRRPDALRIGHFECCEEAAIRHIASRCGELDKIIHIRFHKNDFFSVYDRARKVTLQLLKITIDSDSNTRAGFPKQLIH
jgi:hypothetical protein